jgi:hypothetical protein
LPRRRGWKGQGGRHDRIFHLRARLHLDCRRLRGDQAAPVPRSDTRPLRRRAGAIPLLRCFRLQAASCWPRC